MARHNFKRLIITIMLILWRQQVESDNKRRLLHCDRVEVPDVAKDSPITFSEIDMIFNETYGSAFNVDIIVARDIVSSKLTMFMEVVRCANKEMLDSCEYFQKLTPPNVCLFMSSKHMAWNTLTDSFTPMLRCPLRKGTYVGRSVTFDTNLWQMYSLHEWYWKVTTKVFEGKLYMYSFLMECNSYPYRNKTAG